jgi:hypothetical protein
MARQLHSWLLAPILLGIVLPAYAGAQTSSETSTPFRQRSVRHKPLDLPEGGNNPEELINSRLKSARDQYDVQRYTELIKNNPELKKLLLKELARLQEKNELPNLIDGPIDPQSGQLPESVKSMLEQSIKQANIKLPESGSQEPSKKDIEELGKKLAEQFKKDAGPSTQTDYGSMARPGGPGPMSRGGPMPPPSPPGPGSTGRDTQPPSFRGPMSGSRDETSRELVDFLTKRLSKLEASSPAMQRAVRSLERFKIQEDSRFLRLNQGSDKLKSSVPDWIKSFRPDALRPERGWPFERGLPDVGLPRVRLSGSWFPSGPRVNIGAAGAGAAGAGTVLLYLVIIAIAGVIVWKVLKLNRVFGMAGAGGSWRLGPWPVNPAAVRTREEMVKAFEYLSLLLLGPSARHRNHLEIAADLSNDKRHASVDRHLAAQHLAALYEQARYAPPSDALPEAELPAARRYLCYLAGVSHV